MKAQLYENLSKIIYNSYFVLYIIEAFLLLKEQLKDV